MSFILDALRKSEHERQRTSTPGLSHVPLATPRRELPRWTVIVIGALGAAVLVLGGAWWQSSRAPLDSAAVPVARTAAPRELPAAAPAPPTALPTAPATAPQVERSLSRAAESESPSAGAPPNATAPATALAEAAAPATNQQSALPSAVALAAQGIVLPTLRLELHAYAEQPSARFVFINGRKYVEGDRLAEGPELLTIAPNGAVLRHLGQRFLLTPE